MESNNAEICDEIRVSIPPDDMERLLALSVDTGVTVEWLAQYAVRRYLASVGEHNALG